MAAQAPAVTSHSQHKEEGRSKEEHNPPYEDTYRSCRCFFVSAVKTPQLQEKLGGTFFIRPPRPSYNRIRNHEGGSRTPWHRQPANPTNRDKVITILQCTLLFSLFTESSQLFSVPRTHSPSHHSAPLPAIHLHGMFVPHLHPTHHPTASHPSPQSSSSVLH